MIPIYRAKKIDSNEYVEGFLKNCTDTGLDIFWIQSKQFIDYQIDTNTLSINFPNMIDSQGNKIFASLQEEGKGGDIIETELKRVCTVKYKEYFFYADNKDYHCNCFGFIHSKTIGIQQ